MHVIPGVRYATVVAVVQTHFARRARGLDVEAEDLVGDVCAELLTAPAAFDPSRGGEYSYVRMVVRTVFCRLARRRASRMRLERSVEATPGLFTGQATLGTDEMEARVGCLRAVAERFGTSAIPASVLLDGLMRRDYTKPSARAYLLRLLRGKRPGRSPKGPRRRTRRAATAKTGRGRKARAH